MELKDYPYQTYDKVRYRDTDRQGHVNNAVFSQYFETGRVEILFNKENPMYSQNCQFVIARLEVDLLSEIVWPGIVNIGSKVVKIGNSSIVIEQGLFQNDILCATSKTVIVQMNETTRKSQNLNERARRRLSELM